MCKITKISTTIVTVPRFLLKLMEVYFIGVQYNVEILTEHQNTSEDKKAKQKEINNSL